MNLLDDTATALIMLAIMGAITFAYKLGQFIEQLNQEHQQEKRTKQWTSTARNAPNH